MDEPFRAIYRWKLKEGMEPSFVKEWDKLTSSIYESCGSFGAKLGKGDDNIIYSYAEWPSKESRAKCSLLNEQSEAFQALMKQCISHKFEQTHDKTPEEAFPEVSIEWLVDHLHNKPYTS